MRKLLLFSFLLLGAPAMADKTWFHANFDHPYKVESDKEGTAYVWQHGHPTQTQMVYVTKQRLDLKRLKAYVIKTMPPSMGHIEESNTRIDNHPAIQLEGINSQGVPFVVGMVTTPDRSLFCGSVSYDTVRNRNFVHTLKLR